MRGRRTGAAAVALLMLVVGGCGGNDESQPKSPVPKVTGAITLDGADTLVPYAQADAELFNRTNPYVRIAVAGSGTDRGLSRLCSGDVDVALAARRIELPEIRACRRHHVRYRSVQVADEGIAVVTNRDLKLGCLTRDKLRRLWRRGSRIRSYRQLDRRFPDVPVRLFGPDRDSGTYGFFTERINGREGRSRQDYRRSADDDVIIRDVTRTPGGLGYFSFPYYDGSRDAVNLVGVGNTPVTCDKPDVESVQSGAYFPLSRPLFMYPSERALERPEVRAFLEFTVAHQAQIARAAQIVPMTDAQSDDAREALAAG